MSNKWPKQSECLKLFGNPTTAAFSKNLTTIKPPFLMTMGEIEIKRITINKICAEAMLRILNKAWDKCGHDIEKIKKERIDQFSGAFNVRPMRGLSTLSTHAYGLAVDFDAVNNPLGKAIEKNKKGFQENSLLVNLMDEEGAIWGGRWRTRPDGMHFQFAIVG
jgi:hypothetical protein